jgi:uncharacterized membrane protein
LSERSNRQSHRSDGNNKITAKRRSAVTRDKNGDDLHVEQQELTVWAGALPSPDDLAHFNTLIPNGAERIMQLTEREQSHRIALEEQIVPQNLAAQSRGQWLGFVLSIVSLGLAAATSYAGVAPIVSIALVGVPVLAVAKALVDSWKSK